MGRYAVHRKDANEEEICSALCDVGATVAHLAGSTGLPDLLVGFRGKNYLLEVKPSAAAPIRPKQQQFIDYWHGPVAIVRNVEEALRAIKARPVITQREISAHAQDAWLSPDDIEDENGNPWGV